MFLAILCTWDKAFNANASFVDREKDELESSDESDTEMETEVEGGKPGGNVSNPVAPVKTKYDLMMKNEVSLGFAVSLEGAVMGGVALWSHMIHAERIV